MADELGKKLLMTVDFQQFRSASAHRPRRRPICLAAVCRPGEEVLMRWVTQWGVAVT